MMGRKTLRQIREQLAAARAGVTPPTANPVEALESLERIADELRSDVDDNAREPTAECDPITTETTSEK